MSTGVNKTVKAKEPTPKQKVVAYLKEQEAKFSERSTLNSLIERFYPRHKDFFDGLGLQANVPINLQSKDEIEGFDPSLDNDELPHENGERDRERVTPAKQLSLADIELVLNDIIVRLASIEDRLDKRDTVTMAVTPTSVATQAMDPIMIPISDDNSSFGDSSIEELNDSSSSGEDDVVVPMSAINRLKGLISKI